MASTLLPVKGVAFPYEIALVSVADKDIFQTSVSLSAGDVLVYQDSVIDGNIDTLPVEIGTSGVLSGSLSAAEMNADRVVVKFHDVAGDQWQDAAIVVYTSANALGDIPTPPTAAANADAVWDEATAGHVAAGSFGLWASGLVAAIVAALTASATFLTAMAAVFWAYVTRTLTSTAAATVAAVTGSDLAITKYANYDATLTGMTISASWLAIKFTLKGDPNNADSAAILQITVSNPAVPASDGVLYVAGAAATVAQRTQGSLTVTQAAGTVAIHLDDDLTAVLARVGAAGYDIKEIVAAGSTVLTDGTASISATETAALA